MSSKLMCRTPGTMREPIFKGDYSFNVEELKMISMPDLIVFAVAVTIVTLIGCYHAWRSRMVETVQQFLQEYHLMPAFPMGLSAFASFASAITMMGAAAEAYDNSTTYLWISGGLVLVGLTSAHIFHPVLYKLNVSSSHQYLEFRFSKNVRAFAAGMFLLHMLSYNSLVLCAPSVVFEKVTGFPLKISIFCIGTVCVISSAMGGMRGIVWADIFHVVLMFAALLAVLFGATVIVGGLGTALEANERAHKVTARGHESKSSGSPWSLLIGGFFTFGCSIAVNQNVVQKIVSCNTLKDAQIAVYIAVFCYTALTCLSCFIGFYMGAFYENCDPLQDRHLHVTDSDGLLPLFAMDVLGNKYGLVGLFAAGLFSGALSTMSSSICAVTTSALEDFIDIYTVWDLTDKQFRYLAQLISLTYGFVSLMGAYFAAEITTHILQVTLSGFGVTMGPVFGVFILGMFFPCANTTGAICGMLGSIAVTVTLYFTTNLSGHPDPTAVRCVSNCDPSYFANNTEEKVVSPHQMGSTVYQHAYMWIASSAVLSCLVIGLFISVLTGSRDPPNTDPALMVSLCDEVFPFSHLPGGIRKYLKIIAGPVRKRSQLSSVDLRSSLHLNLGTFGTPHQPTLQINSFQSTSNAGSIIVDNVAESTRVEEESSVDNGA